MKVAINPIQFKREREREKKKRMGRRVMRDTVQLGNCCGFLFWCEKKIPKRSRLCLKVKTGE